MSEKEVIERTLLPVTVGSLLRDLGSLGLNEGDTVIVHSSLSRLGWVCGGAQAVVQALLRAVGPEGTLVMPAHSGNWSDPAGWANPPVPAAWVDTIYEEMPAFDPALTPTWGMGQIAETFRAFPGTLRSNHPQVSFCAQGKHAATIVAEHPLTPQFGESSPLGKLYEMDAKIALLGVGYDSCTTFHLAEASLAGMPEKSMGAAIAEDGRRVWKRFEDYAYDSDDFEALGSAFESEGNVVRSGKVGEADCKLLRARDVVDYARRWLSDNRRLTIE
ncbi:aminoglycoside N(3)-acetyltransferase [Cohnella sp. GCM10027633]|uniref:aminoglycoside N(3)-acetyltransferase n=1 Tax=unclassified Cohnella TaxID=2636738 RepID=UPI00362D6FEA